MGHRTNFLASVVLPGRFTIQPWCLMGALGRSTGLPAAASLVPSERKCLEALGESLGQCQLYQYQRPHFPESCFSFPGRVDLFFSTPSYPVMFWAPCTHWCPQPLARICLVPGGVHKILLSPERKMLGKKKKKKETQRPVWEGARSLVEGVLDLNGQNNQVLHKPGKIGQKRRNLTDLLGPLNTSLS